MKLFIIFFLQFFCFSKVESQTFKHIDRFESDKYYPAFITGTGKLKDTVSKQGLSISYHFDKGDKSSFTFFRNYGSHPQDYSFMPNAFALVLKGGITQDQIRFRLWEDLNRNGKFDSSDEVFASQFYPLGDTVWQMVQFPTGTFKRVAGNGNDSLDLNRIRAWDIEVQSQNNKSHSGELYVKDLRFYSNYVPKTSKEASLTGTFITFSKSDSGKNGYWTQQRWISELMKMKKLNLNKIIIQYSVYQDRAWYSQSTLPFIKYRETALNKLFLAAEAVGIKVYVGLFFSESWYKNDKSLESTYNDIYNIDKVNMDELYDLFGSSNAFGGWYIPQEVNDYDWMDASRKKMLFLWLQEIAGYAHQKDSSKPVIIAPYFNLWQPADIIEDWYNDLLSVAKDIDWIYPQDGIGTSRKDVHIDIPHYCDHIKKACEEHGRKFGLVVEAFRQLTGWPLDNGLFSAASVHIEQLNDQIQEAYQLKPNDIILYNWDYLLNESKHNN